MTDGKDVSPLASLQREIAEGGDLAAIARRFLERANGSASRNTYLHLDAEDVERQVRALPERFPDASSRPPLYGVLVSIKDCFDVAGTVTTFGSRFYAGHSGVAENDSAMAQRLREAGCILPGKTHLQALAYGITGENRDYGDCVQPRDGAELTGGSSSGAAASVQEGSAVAGIGTDTGGSIRVPAALCGLIGYRTSQAIAATWWPEVWRGSMPLAQSFDTPGVIFRDLRDLPLLAEAIFGVVAAEAPKTCRVGFVAESFLSDCKPEVLVAYRLWQDCWREAGASVEEFDASAWSGSVPIFAGIQASEAAVTHRGHFKEFEAGITSRLAWGASLTDEEVAGLRAQHAAFRDGMAGLFEYFDLLMLPCAPMSRLGVGEDHSTVRPIILRYTTPFSLAGLPAVSLPGELIGGGFGTGVQVAAASGADEMLVAYVARLTESLAERGKNAAEEL